MPPVDAVQSDTVDHEWNELLPEEEIDEPDDSGESEQIHERSEQPLDAHVFDESVLPELLEEEDQECQSEGRPCEEDVKVPVILGVGVYRRGVS